MLETLFLSLRLHLRSKVQPTNWMDVFLFIFIFIFLIIVITIIYSSVIAFISTNVSVESLGKIYNKDLSLRLYISLSQYMHKCSILYQILYSECLWHASRLRLLGCMRGPRSPKLRVFFFFIFFFLCLVTPSPNAILTNEHNNSVRLRDLHIMHIGVGINVFFSKCIRT